jgi:hypothetical protein
MIRNSAFAGIYTYTVGWGIRGERRESTLLKRS